MDQATVVAVIIAIAMGAGIAYLIYMGKSPKEAAGLIQEVESVGRMAVLAAEQYARTGKLTTSRQKMAFAAQVFRKWIPAARGVTDEDMFEVLESFVPLANNLGLKLEIIDESKTVPPMQG